MVWNMFLEGVAHYTTDVLVPNSLYEPLKNKAGKATTLHIFNYEDDRGTPQTDQKPKAYKGHFLEIGNCKKA